jgi:hypothetical protein
MLARACAVIAHVAVSVRLMAMCCDLSHLLSGGVLLVVNLIDVYCS